MSLKALKELKRRVECGCRLHELTVAELVDELLRRKRKQQKK